MRSGGRYGPSPFLIGHYGGIGDIAQGFCRAAAVSGGVYILARKVTAVTQAPLSKTTENEDAAPTSKATFNYAIDLEDFPDTLSCNLIISSPSYVPPNIRDQAFQLPSSSGFQSNVGSIARCIAIIDQALSIRSPENEMSSSPEQDTADALGASPPQVSQSTSADSAIVFFPPSSVAGGSVTHSATALINGEGSLSTPKGKCGF